MSCFCFNPSVVCVDIEFIMTLVLDLIPDETSHEYRLCEISVSANWQQNNVHCSLLLARRIRIRLISAIYLPRLQNIDLLNQFAVYYCRDFFGAFFLKCFDYILLCAFSFRRITKRLVQHFDENDKIVNDVFSQFAVNINSILTMLLTGHESNGGNWRRQFMTTQPLPSVVYPNGA